MIKLSEERLIKKGAEAHLYLINWFGRKAIKKIRVPKYYRDRRLDEMIRLFRTKREAKMLVDVKKIGFPSPVLYDYIPNQYTIVMEFIEGKLLRDAIKSGELNDNELREIFYQIGVYVAKLHGHKMVHGDLTTSNIFVLEDLSVVFIDFGLGEYNASLEDFGVEIRVFDSAIKSTHYEKYEIIFNSFKEGYLDSFDLGETVFKKFEEISKRGRYVAERRVRRKFLPQQ